MGNIGGWRAKIRNQPPIFLLQPPRKKIYWSFAINDQYFQKILVVGRSDWSLNFYRKFREFTRIPVEFFELIPIIPIIPQFLKIPKIPKNCVRHLGGTMT